MDAEAALQSAEVVTLETEREYIAVLEAPLVLGVQLQTPELQMLTLGEQGPPGPPGVGGAVVSPDADNALEQRPNGLFAAPRWGAAEW